MVRCYIALGANLGEPVRVVSAAIEALRTLPGSRFIAASSLYRTAPVGLLHQPDFINAVVALEVDDAVLPAPTLLDHLLDIEGQFGRQRSVRNAPRTLDLDLLLYGDSICHEPRCTVPHPRMHERVFVLAPLLEIAPDISLPGLGPATQCLAACRDQQVERLL